MTGPTPSGFDWDRFHRLPIVGILRGFTREQTSATLQAAAAGGLTNLEITMNTPAAIAQIAEAREKHGDRVNIGAGTVTSLALLEAALGAGASFIVTPTVRTDVIVQCAASGVPVFPGAFSPGEICLAWESGALLVKVFPAEATGPSYIQRLKESFPAIRLMPTGGVDLKTFSAFIGAGADGFGIGGPLFDKQRIESGDWAWVRKQVEAFRIDYERATASAPPPPRW